MKINPDSLWSCQGEAAILAGCMLEPHRIPGAMGQVTDAAFFDERHKTLWQVIVARFAAGAPCDPAAVAEWIKTNGKLDDVGGVPYLSKIMDSVTSGADTDYWVRVVLDRERYREAVRAVEQMSMVLEQDAGDPKVVTEKIQALALGLEAAGTGQDQWADLAKAATKVAVAVRGDTRLLKTGFRDLDRHIGGLAPGELVVIGGRPSMGKSALAVTMALNMAKAGLHVLVASVEMTCTDWIERTVGIESLTCLHSVKTGSATEDEFLTWYGGSLRLEKIRGSMLIHEGLDRVDRLAVFARQQKAARGVDIVFVDYLQLLSGKGENRCQEVGGISRGIKRLAKSMRVPIAVLCQLNRATETRENHRPRLSDLRESGDIEQDADFVVLLHREDYYRKKEDPTALCDGLIEMHLAKARRGPTGLVKAVFVEKLMQVADLVQDPDGRTYPDYDYTDKDDTEPERKDA